MEYPDEIIYKINQFYREAKFNIENIKTVVNNIYKNRTKYLMKSTNFFINNFLKQHIDFIKSNINYSFIMNEYYLTKYNELDNLYK